MKHPSSAELESLWARHAGEWREPALCASPWQDAQGVDVRLLRHVVRGAWWDTLAECGITLLVTREYEHLVMALRADKGRPHLTCLRIPHPSGIAVDRERHIVHVASTRNPNQVYDLLPVTRLRSRLGGNKSAAGPGILVPVRVRYYPGRLYLHDLAMIGPALHANAVGQNAIVRLEDDGSYEPVWWPACIETKNGPLFERNHLQLNSIAAGKDIRDSYFSASTARVSGRRPGHKNFPVKGRGVIFSGATREPVAEGLTRPHSARLRAGRVWVDNSGYGELGFVSGGRYQAAAALPGWTRGLCFCKDIAFVGTSRVIPRFRHYAPGLDVDASVCGVHAVEVKSGKVRGSITWPYGNQIFAVDWLPPDWTTGFPFSVRAGRSGNREKELFYGFDVSRENHR
jgi:uncharacterized protein (TIGR03032 family)